MEGAGVSKPRAPHDLPPTAVRRAHRDGNATRPPEVRDTSTTNVCPSHVSLRGIEMARSGPPQRFGALALKRLLLSSKRMGDRHGPKDDNINNNNHNDRHNNKKANTPGKVVRVRHHESSSNNHDHSSSLVEVHLLDEQQQQR